MSLSNYFVNEISFLHYRIYDTGEPAKTSVRSINTVAILTSHPDAGIVKFSNKESRIQLIDLDHLASVSGGDRVLHIRLAEDVAACPAPIEDFLLYITLKNIS